MLSKANNLHYSDWITWNGGDRPIDPVAEVQVKFRDGEYGYGEAGDFTWWYSDCPSHDIVAYRVVETTKFSKGDTVTLVSGPASEMKVIGVHVYEDGSVVYRCVDQQEQWDYFSESQLCKFVPKEDDVLFEGEGWITWNGGNCPVPFEIKAEVKLRNGDWFTGRAGGFYWEHYNRSTDIIAYLVVKPHTTETNNPEDEVIEIKMTIGDFRKLLTESVKQVLKEHLDNR